jgi:hypothetical protein
MSQPFRGYGWRHGEETWRQQGDIRNVISVSKLVKKHDGSGDIAEIIKTLSKYGGE